MSEPVAYEQFEDAESAGGVGLPPTPETSADLRRLSGVPMELSVEIGRTRMTVGETLQLRAGSIVTLERLAGEPVDLLVNGTPLARGEVVIVDEEFGLRVTEIVEDDPALVNPGEPTSGGEDRDPADTAAAPPAPTPADPAVQE